MTKNLVEKGNIEHPIILYNRTKSRAETHCSLIGHSTVASSLQEAIVASDIIWSCLENENAVAETFEQILALSIQGKLFIECSTVLPDEMATLSKKVLATGAEFVAMPGWSVTFIGGIL
jgi:3-hydroxyisobutyrate dehydrogenase-like beta-hydroxyacid dehydrogenase